MLAVPTFRSVVVALHRGFDSCPKEGSRLVSAAASSCRRDGTTDRAEGTMQRTIDSARVFLCATALIAFASGDAVAAPTISGVNPSTGPTTGGVLLTITGAAFSPSGNSATLDGNACSVVSEGTGQILCTAPEGTGALNDVQVTDDTGSA